MEHVSVRQKETRPPHTYTEDTVFKGADRQKKKNFNDYKKKNYENVVSKFLKFEKRAESNKGTRRNAKNEQNRFLKVISTQAKNK